MRTLSLLLLFYSPFGLLRAETAITFTQVNTAEEWTAAVAKAEAADKLLFVDVYTDWCGYCKMMDRDVFALAEVGQQFNQQFINIKLDAETEFGEKFAYQYGVDGFPTYLFLDAKEELVGEIGGYVEAAPFVDETNRIVNRARLLPELKAKAEAGQLNAKELRQYAVVLYDQDPVEARRLADQALEDLTLADVQDADNFPFLMEFGYDVKGPVWPLVFQNAEAVKTSLGEENFEAYLGRVYNGGLAYALTRKQPAYLEAVIEEVLPVYLPDTEEQAEAAFITRKIYLGNNAHVDDYRTLVESYADEHAAEDPNFWYNQAFEVVEDYNEGNMLTLAFPWLDQYLGEHPGDFDGLTLYAYGLAISGDYAAAKSKGQAALEVAHDVQEADMIQQILDMIDQAQGGDN
ncbi:MAG TPA: hypothetical protein DCE41_37455 [Cytophagales bacterium]|nr:hypothetical protein [Cytophagales bacterium]HAA20574.1 hypothetical protein [Cytophagales bacterium]HAP65174.1 hypothetical protein [Cytophagales bacterium]